MNFFDSDGVHIGFVDLPAEGEPIGPPVLLIHGFASNHKINWVQTGWVSFLREHGRRVIALDNRGHGESEKLYDVEAYTTSRMARDARNLMQHLHISQVDVIGYSMGARISALLTLAAPDLVRRLVLGGLGYRLVDGDGLPQNLADAMEAADASTLQDPVERMFRVFAERTGSDRRALAACIRGSRQVVSVEELARIRARTLVAIGTKDPIAGDGRALVALLPFGQALDIPGRDHNLAVGDKTFKAGVLEFLDAP
ncbi:MAG: alpha/beta hydrolase [Hyphomicrobiales bacterium]|nr:alpha/beta hydrolase [Hyphomicrobiales bacterium]MDE2115736.1 alpha/beta hydrolase [Hyphomicrobiales bacterium]